MKSVDKGIAINADTVYCDGTLIARDVEVNLPSIEAATVTFWDMGETSVPILGAFNGMESTIKFKGDDNKQTLLAQPIWHNLEIRSVQTDLTVSGNQVHKPVKHRMTAMPISIGNGDLKPGDAKENETKVSVNAYYKFINNVEVIAFDRNNKVFRINGKDYYKSIEGNL